MYFYSLAVFALLCYMIPRIHRREALSAISFAYLYLVDSVVNVVYTLLFAGSWFLTLAERDHAIAAASAQDLAVGNPVAANNATIAAVVSDAAATGIAAGVLQPESATSIMIIAISWTIRLYFVTVAFAFAREVVRASATESEGPFEGSNGGEGWQGRLGRALVGVGRGYWKGDGYATFGGSKFRRSSDPGDNGRRFRRNDRISMEV